ncbi:AbrB family transcriptional regulator [Ureibacillus sp. MALMAid1270]|uniref:AbrB family transcriptional regulator n=1 Tax=Ureibacillus sp. MALMAid1270 TaxID=3411629 RepID=UPI003BA48496
MKIKILCMFVVAILFSYFLELINFPANWLLGSLIVGMVFSLTWGNFNIHRNVFKGGLVLLGSSFGISLSLSFFSMLAGYTLPMIVMMVLILGAFVLVTFIMYKNSNLDLPTAIYCCIPGGASEVIGSSKDAGADESTVAAYHSLRIVMFVLLIPIILGVSIPTPPPTDFLLAFQSIQWQAIPFIIFILGISFYLDKISPIPLGILFIGMIVSFVINITFNLHMEFQLIPIIGQIILGTLVGQKLTRVALKNIRAAGPIIIICLVIFLAISFLIAFIFSMMSGLNYSVSLLATVPAGAAEMSSTAFALNLDPTTIVAIHTVRVITIFLLLPFIRMFTLKHVPEKQCVT